MSSSSPPPDESPDSPQSSSDFGARSRGNWTKEEDQMLRDLVAQYGLKKWAVIATKLPSGRIGKQCRERWVNHLDVYVKKAPWTNEEDNILIQGQQRLGNKWCAISKLLEGRPENAVKNRWNSIVNRLKHQQQQLAQQQQQTPHGGGGDEGMTPPPPPPFPSAVRLSSSAAAALGVVDAAAAAAALPPALAPSTTLTPAAASASSSSSSSTSFTISGSSNKGGEVLQFSSEADRELLCAFSSLQRTSMQVLKGGSTLADRPPTSSTSSTSSNSNNNMFELEALEGICALKQMPK